MNIILTMNITGAVLLGFYFLVKRFLEERLTKKYLYRILQVNVVCFLVPLMLVGEAYRGLWWDLKLLLNKREAYIQTTPRTPMFLQIEKQIDYSIGMRGKMILMCCYLILVLLSFTAAVIQDRVEKRSVRAAIRSSKFSAIPDLPELQKELKIRKKVDVCLCGEKSQISTIGLFHPIIFYKDPEDPDARRILLSHELYHMKERDILWKWIAILANCIHFYNPLAYILRWEIERMQELRCDEQVMTGLDLDTECRQKYANLLVEYSKEESNGSHFSIFFGEKNSYKRLQERIEWIMRKDTKKKLSKRLAAALTAVVLGATSLTALAYDEMRWWHKDGEMADTWGTGESAEVIAVRAYAHNTSKDVDTAKDYPILYEMEYIDKEGNVHPLNAGESTNALCFFHSYDDFQVVEHYLLRNGGCEVWFYDAVMCIKCSYTKSKELIAIDRFDVCPHNLD